MNILQFTYDFQTKIYSWNVNVVNAGVWLSNSFGSKFCPQFCLRKRWLKMQLVKTKAAQ